MVFPESASLWWLAAAVLAAVLGMGAGVWLRATAARREHARRDAERAARRARAEAWWRQHSLSTLPHSRFFESAFDDPPSLFAATQPPRGR